MTDHITHIALTPALTKFPLGSIRPTGWLRDQLEIQLRGLTGMLEEHWPDIRDSAWHGGTGESWERGPYFLDGQLPQAYALGDKEQIAYAQEWIEWTLKSQKESGDFGPDTQNPDWWPQMVMLKVLIQYFEATDDARIIPFMTRFFAYELAHLDERPLDSWGEARGGENVLSILWLYRKTNDEFLLQLLEKVREQSSDWYHTYHDFPFTRFVDSWDHLSHGVNVAMSLKYLGQDYLITGDDKYREEVHHALGELMKFHGQLSGLFSTDEWLAGTHPSQGTELCAVVEYMFSMESLLEDLGDATFGDYLEAAAFNALPATISRDWKSHQYDQQVNQVMCNRAVRGWTSNGEDSNLFGLEPHYGCCTANMHQGWPKYSQYLWMHSSELGLTAISYAPCTLETDGVKLRVESDYPVRNSATITVESSTPQKISLRIPQWASSVHCTVNGHESPVTDGDYLTLNEVPPHATIEISFGTEVRFIHRAQNATGVKFGALLFALPIKETWLYAKGEGPLPDWQVLPASNWNYALQIGASAQVRLRNEPLPAQVFDSRHSPVSVHVKGRLVPEWGMKADSADTPPLGPVHTSTPIEDLELVPYGGAKLRIAEFPISE